MATDNFNRANETPLAAPWTKQGGGSNINLSGNALAKATVGDTFWYYAGAASSADQYSEAKQVTLPVGDDWGPAVRIGGTGITGYFASTYNNGGGGTGECIGKIISGTFTQVKTVAVTTVAGDVIRCEAQGTTLRWIKNGTLVDSATDTSLSSGQPGLFWYEASGTIDDWAGGDLGGSAVALAAALAGVGLASGTRALSVEKPLAAALAAVGLASGTRQLGVDKRLAAVLGGVGGATGDLPPGNAISLASALAGSGAIAAPLQAFKQLSGVLAGVGGATGTRALTVQKTLTATLQAAGSITAPLVNSKPLQSVLAGAQTMMAALDVGIVTATNKLRTLMGAGE